MIQRDRLKVQANKSNDSVLWDKYRKSRNKVNSIVRKTKAKYYHDQITANIGNPHGIWKIINQLKSRKSNVTTINQINFKDTLFSDPTDVSNALNQHFIEIGPSLASNIPNCSVEFSESTFTFRAISPKDVLDSLNKLSINKAIGPDNLSSRLLKEAAPYISQSLCNLFNKSLNAGTFPSEWKALKT